MPVSKHALVTFLQPVVPLASRPFLVLPQAVEDIGCAEHEREAQHADVDGVAPSVSWPTCRNKLARIMILQWSQAQDQ